MIAENKPCLAAQRRATGGDWFDFLKPLIDASGGEGVLTRDEWLDALDEVSRDASLRRDIEVLLDRGSDDPAALIAGLFDRSGVASSRDGDKVRLN